MHAQALKVLARLVRHGIVDGGKEPVALLKGIGLTMLPDLAGDLGVRPGFALQEAIEVGEVACQQLREDDLGDPEPAVDVSKGHDKGAKVAKTGLGRVEAEPPNQETVAVCS